MQKRPAYDPAKIEKKWQKKWASSKIYKSVETRGKSKYYALDMFPYPSGEGLHVGHPKGYIATDIVSRMKRMQGMNVLHPIGFDAFGLPAENYAIKTKTNPEVAVAKNVARYKKQLELLGFDYDWSREVNTTDPKFYKWTQWIFLQLWKKGLAYESNEPVNWCPTDKTVLANEDVENGRCERCGTLVEKKPMRQWVLKITDYAERMLRDMDAKHEPLFVTTKGPGAIRKDMPFVERDAIIAIVEHWSEDKFIGLKWKQVAWQSPITGGIEEGQTAVEAAINETLEETGYTHPELVSDLGMIHANFFHVPKNQNRRGHFRIIHLKLKDGDRREITDDEKSKHDVLWLDRKEMSEFLGSDAEEYGWDRLLNPGKSNLLDWPEHIKESQRNWIGRSEGTEIDFRMVPKNRKIRFALIHGFKGSVGTDFFPWLKKELEKRGHEVEAHDLPNTDDAKESGQVDYLLKNYTLDENTVVIAHSLGCVVALKALMKSERSISGITLVAPAIDPNFDGDVDEKKFHKNFTWNYDYALIKKLTSGRIAVLSDTREVKRIAYLKQLANNLSANLIEAQSAEFHFCGDEETEVLKSVTPNITVFTTRPDTLFGVTYVVLAPEHPWVSELVGFTDNKSEVEAYIARAAKATTIERTDTKREKTGVELKGMKAINPANGEEVPIWIADYVLADYGTGAVMGVPSNDERDAEFSKKYSLPIREINLEDKEEMTSKFGRKVVKYKLRDWVFSRQRYWGEPIPMIHCEKCGAVPVPEKDLPVLLPKVKSYEPTGTGESPLAAIAKWVNVKCPECGGKAKRETNTMPQWAGSSWYYLRYMDPKNSKKPVGPTNEKHWSPVDLYVGGAEHATRHLIYARFWHKFLYDIGVVSNIEPFRKLRSVGLIMGEDGRKMSKRFGNVVNPDEIVATYGADTLRLYEMFMGPFDQQIAWSTASMVGSRRFIERVWKMGGGVSVSSSLGNDYDHSQNQKVTKRDTISLRNAKSSTVARIIHRTIKKVTEDIENLRFNTAISTMMIALNELEKPETADKVSQADFETYLKLLAPFAPHVTDELWSQLGNKKSIHISPWPTYDPEQLVDSEVTIALQVNGKTRGSFMAPTGTGKDELEKRAREAPEAKKWLENKQIKRVIVVPDKLVNIVAQ